MTQIPKKDLLAVDKAITLFEISRDEYQQLDRVSKLFIQAKTSEFVHLQGEKIPDALLGKKVYIPYTQVKKAIKILTLSSSMDLYEPLRKEFQTARYIQSQNFFRKIIVFIIIVIYLIWYFVSGEELSNEIFKRLVS